MPAPAPTDRLRAIKRLDQLLAYLRDELDWPVGNLSVEDVTFDYDPEELGVPREAKVGFREIKQLRPLAAGQPWGVFWVSFEKKKLPVVLLRRVLRELSIRRRPAPPKAARTAWQPEDLLFISSYGDTDDAREISLAHFALDPAHPAELPVLRVLDWDAHDTALKLRHLDRTLHDYLRWPADEHNLTAWRQQWRAPFRHRFGHTIRTADALAETLAALARRIRRSAEELLEAESEKGPLRRLHRAFQAALVHDLDEAAFADTYAQTVTYGLLTAAISRTDMAAGAQGTVVAAADLPDFVPVTNPFLREMLETFLKVGGRKGGIDFDELGIQAVVELLRGEETDLPAILRDFGNKKPGEDPVIHFYEHFLAAYNKQLKIQRGVFYTPQPVVSYIVRSVHELLQTEFALEDGLASTITWGEMVERSRRQSVSAKPSASDPATPQSEIRTPQSLRLPPKTDEHGETRKIDPSEFFVQILDPATGTATFLVEVIEVVHRHLVAKWEKGGLAAMPTIPNLPKDVPLPRSFADWWNVYVPQALLPRIYGYELMMAPYAIAHMKIGLKLHETGYRFGSTARVGIYLTNALEPKVRQLPQIGFDALAHEAAAVNEIKWYKRFTVVIGNPPYANYSANLTPTARRLVDKYRSFRGQLIRERNQLQFERNLQEDAVKFLSIGEDAIASSGLGLLCYITNSVTLASKSLRGLREHLRGTFSSIWELNLHGGGNEIGDDADADENVFDIIQGVAVHLYAKSRGAACPVLYSDLFGPRSGKYSSLSRNTVRTSCWLEVSEDAENLAFTPQDEDGAQPLPRLDSIFLQKGAGVKTNNDSVLIAFDEPSLLEQVRDYDRSLIRGVNPSCIVQPILYRPFDERKIYYHEEAVASRSFPTMQHFIAGPNIGLVASSTWTTAARFSVNVSRLMVEMKTGTHDRGTTFFPFFRYETLLGGKAQRSHNFTTEFLRTWADVTGTAIIQEDFGDLQSTAGSIDILRWFFGLLHSPEYRRRYRAKLAQGFPLVLIGTSKQMLQTVTRLGAELVALHLLEFEVSEVGRDVPAEPKPSAQRAALPKASPYRYRHLTEFVGSADTAIDKIAYADGTVWIDKARTTGFAGVPEPVWNFHVGGYQVCEKWLKDRKGRTLSADDIAHYRKVVVALHETIRLMAEIDVAIANHGGWPGAFALSPSVAPAPASASSAPVKPPTKPRQSDRGLRTEDELPLG